jgi:iron complex outermembrane receptor protein
VGVAPCAAPRCGGVYRSEGRNDINSQFAGSYGASTGVRPEHAARWRLHEFLRIDNVATAATSARCGNDANGRYYEPAPQRSMMLGVQASLQF